MEGDGVEAVVGLISKEVLALAGGQVRGNVETTGKLSRSPASATIDASQEISRLRETKDLLVQGTEGITTRNFTGDEEVFLAKVVSALPGRRSPGSQSVNGDLSGLVDTDGVDIESSDGHAGESGELSHDGRVPFAQTILHGGELGELTLPVGMDTESFHVTILVKVGLETAIGLDGDDSASVEPKFGQST